MRQSDSVSEELDTENVQCALDFENTMNELETQLYYRHLPPKEVALRVMEAACKFYDADWCGLIQVDLDLGLWKPLWWHNECQEDKTTILTNEFESSEFLDRWVKAVRRGTPMVVSDAEDVKDTYPDEYRLYERLGIKSVLAIPLEPRQIALIAVRNPQRYTMLKLLAYVLLAAYNDKRMADSLSMAFSPENIKSSHDVFISLFGELKIHTSHGVLPESDLKSPKISRLLTFMLLSNKKALSSLEIVQMSSILSCFHKYRKQSFWTIPSGVLEALALPDVSKGGESKHETHFSSHRSASGPFAFGSGSRSSDWRSLRQHFFPFLAGNQCPVWIKPYRYQSARD